MSEVERWILKAVKLALDHLPHELSIHELHLVVDASHESDWFNLLIMKHKWTYEETQNYSELCRALLRNWKVGGNK